MKNLKRFDELFESLSSQTRERDKIAKAYFEVGDITRKDGVVIGEYEGVKIRVISRDLVSKEYPEWEKYIGSHHWGKKTSYIPENEIWIIKDTKFTLPRIKKLLNHEIIERQTMRALRDDKRMSAKNAWDQAHGFVKKIGF